MRSGSTSSTSTIATASIPPPGLPFTPGNEGAGEVVEVGPEVKDFKPGDRVAYCGAIGAYAEERNIEARYLFKLPRGISYETAAAMMLKGLTAQYLLRQTYRVKEGDTILVHAAAGGVGLILCQWGRALGANVIGAVGSPEKAELARKAGAHHTILYREEDFVKRVEEITKGEKCAVVYDGVGKATFPGSLDCLRPFGMFVSFGSASGGIEAFDIGLLMRKGSLFATRPTLFTFTRRPGAGREDGARPVPGGRERRRHDPHRPAPAARRSRRGASRARGARDDGIRSSCCPDHRPSLRHGLAP